MKGNYRIEEVKYRDFYDWFKARDQNSSEPVLLEKVKNGWNAEKVEMRFSQLKDCDCEYLMKYVDVMKKNNELWVIIPS